jgi:hypothetical protein
MLPSTSRRRGVVLRCAVALAGDGSDIPLIASTPVMLNTKTPEGNPPNRLKFNAN